MKVLCNQINTVIGPMTILATDHAVIRIDYGACADREAILKTWKDRYLPDHIMIYDSNQVMEWATAELVDYFSGERSSFSFPFHYYGTNFQTQVWEALYTTIPYGTTQTYKDIAETISNPKAVRAVGGAVNKNPLTIVVPCHRVVGSNGTLVGYNGGLDKKAFLLNHEVANMMHMQ